MVRLDESCGITSPLSAFLPTTTNEITKLVSKSACKSCKLDPIPIHLLKDNISTLAPVIADIVNLSGVFPSTFKKALVSPRLKKTTMDPNELKNNHGPKRPQEQPWTQMTSRTTMDPKDLNNNHAPKRTQEQPWTQTTSRTTMDPNDLKNNHGPKRPQEQA